MSYIPIQISPRRRSVSQGMIPISPHIASTLSPHMIMNPMLQANNSITGQSHETCGNITRVGIIFYNTKGILLAKNEVPRGMNMSRYNQFNMLPYHAQSTFTQYSIPLEPKTTEETEKQACERIFLRITKTKLNNRKEKEDGKELAKPHKRRHTDNTCSMIFVIKTTQEIDLPENYIFMTYNEISEITKRPNDRKLLDYKLFADLIKEGRLIENGHEKTVPDGSSEDEIKKALNKVFEIPPGRDMEGLVKIVKADKILGERLDKRLDVLDDDDFEKYLKILRIKRSKFYEYKPESTEAEIVEAINILFDITGTATAKDFVEQFKKNKEKDEDVTILGLTRKKISGSAKVDIPKNLKILKLTAINYFTNYTEKP